MVYYTTLKRTFKLNNLIVSNQHKIHEVNFALVQKPKHFWHQTLWWYSCRLNNDAFGVFPDMASILLIQSFYINLRTADPINFYNSDFYEHFIRVRFIKDISKSTKNNIKIESDFSKGHYKICVYYFSFSVEHNGETRFCKKKYFF